MSDSTTFSTKITGGIQAILALLSLLGTKECEKYVGSALDRGFFCSSVIHVSIFGSLGIVRAAFNILLASLNIRQHGFLGRTKLSASGFVPSGIVAPMIALDSRHPNRFLAETRLEAMLQDEHIENVEGLTVLWAKGILKWNFFLAAITFVMSSIGLLPYIRLILNPHDLSLEALFPFGFGYPILRVLGSGLCVIAAQFLIQLRIFALLKARLTFITIDQLAREADIDLESEINAILERRRATSAWSTELASEECIWALQECLSNSDSESWKYHQKIEEIYSSVYERQMKSIDTRMHRWAGPFFIASLILGCLFTIVGYVGCFYLIQHSANSDGPLSWLVLEALLLIVRLSIWAMESSWGDSKGVAFELQLASHAPLVTCNKFEGDIAHDGVAPLTCSDNFLQDVVTYTGPLPAFVADDVTLYYIFTAQGESGPQNLQVPPRGILYIALFAHKGHNGQILYKEPHQDTFSIYPSSLEHVQGSTTISIKVDFSKRTDQKSHFLTSDAAFMTQLETHYDKINLKIRKQTFNPGRGAFFGKTWAMRTLVEDAEERCGRPMVQLYEEGHSLTSEDVAYLRHGQVVRRWRSMYQQLEEWIGLFIELHIQELLQEIHMDLIFKDTESVAVALDYEADEAEFLVVECQRILELLLISAGRKWDEVLKADHAGMVAAVLQGTFKSATDPKQSVDTSRKQRHADDSRKNKMRTRLTNELEDLLARNTWMRRDKMRNRLTAQMNLADQRVQAGRYTDTAREVIADAWKALLANISLKAGGEPESVVNAVFHSRPLVFPMITDRKSQQDDQILSFSVSWPKFQQSSKFKGLMQPQTSRTIASWHTEFGAQMEVRYETMVKEIEKSYHGVERNKHFMGAKQMNDRCRQRADQLFSRLEAQMAEFEDLHTSEVLTADTHELVDYWSQESLQERARLQNRMQKYLKLSDASIRAVGGPQNMLRALKRSQCFSYIDIRDSELLTSKELTSVVECIPSITGVTLSQGQHIDEAVMANVRAAEEAHRDMCFSSNLIVTDYYRKGHPYLLFKDTGRSSCRIHFHIQAKGDHTITLRHCVTTSEGKVNIWLNGHELRGSWGQTQAVQFNFTDEDIDLPSNHLRDVGQSNVLEIILDNESFGVYWLSDVFLPVRHVQASLTSYITAA